MDLLHSFFSPESPSLKICGVTQVDDALQLAELGVPALGVNFWPQSKRFCTPEVAESFLTQLTHQIIRVGVFVNNAPQIAPALLAANLIDIVQLHGDEDDAQLRELLDQDIPVIRSLSLSTESKLQALLRHYEELNQSTAGALSLLLDAHAPGVYGGTGNTINWHQASEFIQLSTLPVLLAGGITPENAHEAISTTSPCAIDIASGAESEPGIKDLKKIRQLLTATSPSQFS